MKDQPVVECGEKVCLAVAEADDGFVVYLGDEEAGTAVVIAWNDSLQEAVDIAQGNLIRMAEDLNSFKH